jgi:hypothetical protein
MPGKLNGQIEATTPTGWRIIYSSMPRATSSEKSPIISIGMPQATSTFSIARRISPRASSSTLPFSIVMLRARSSKCCFHQDLEPEQVLDTLGSRHAPPLLLGAGSSLGGLVHFFAR